MGCITAFGSTTGKDAHYSASLLDGSIGARGLGEKTSQITLLSEGSIALEVTVDEAEQLVVVGYIVIAFHNQLFL